MVKAVACEAAIVGSNPILGPKLEERVKMTAYVYLKSMSPHHAVEITGVEGPRDGVFMKDTLEKLAQGHGWLAVSGDKRSCIFVTSEISSIEFMDD